MWSRPRLAWAVLLLIWADVTSAEPLVLSDLMAKFAQSRGVEAEFREEKHLPLLTEPLVSEGVFYFSPPDRMVRFSRSPDPGSLLLDGNRLRMEDALGTDEIDLGVEPTAQKLVTQLLVLLRGDLPALERDYEVTLNGTSHSWQLELKTKGIRARAIIQGLSLVGRDGTLQTMTLRGANGEVTRTHYSRVITDRSFSKTELRQLFPVQDSPKPLPARPEPNLTPDS